MGTQADTHTHTGRRSQHTFYSRGFHLWNLIGSLQFYILLDTLPSTTLCPLAFLLMKNEFDYVGSVGKGDYIAIMHVAK